MPPEDTREPVVVALAPDAPVVMAGVAAMLRAGGTRFTTVDLRTVGPGPVTADIVLYDPARRLPQNARKAPGRLRPALVAFSWSLRADTIAQARAEGALAVLSKDLPAEALRAALCAVHEGRPLPYVVAAGDEAGEAPDARPGGLTARELEVLQLICSGHSNLEIADTLYLSINSVKTYIRSAYRRIGVTRRSQAVLWGIHSGVMSSDVGAQHEL